MENKNDVLLRVEHLCQYFPMGGGVVNKAVDDVSFDIKKGEVFGLVGESGCGKTTTGRSIIKLYDITSGNVYFKDVRIAAGLQSYRKEMAEIKTKYNALIAETVDPTAKANPKAERDAKRQIDRAMKERY